MPVYDLECTSCSKQFLDLSHSIHVGHPACDECGAATQNLWTGNRCVVPDDIPGGVEIKNGLCNEDGSPRRYYSHSDINKEAKRRGLVNYVEHVSDPKSGGDKSKYTTRWV